MFRELDIVVVAKMLERDRPFTGVRAPGVGDRGTVVAVTEHSGSSTLYRVEALTNDRSPLWNAEFAEEELSPACSL